MKANELRELSKRLSTRRYITVPVHIDGAVYEFRLRNLSGLEWQQCIEACRDPIDKTLLGPEFGPMIVAWSIVDDDNQPIFASEEGVAEVSCWDGAILTELFKAASEHSVPQKKETTP